MAKLLIIYYTRSGNTRRMAELIAEGAAVVEGITVEVQDVADTQPEALQSADGIIIGSPTYYGSMAAEIKKLIDDSVAFHGALTGKVGGAFSSSANIGGGNETTINDMLNAWLIHGMIVQGDARGDHYGPVSINLPDKRVIEQCTRYGKRTAELVKQLFG